MMRWIFCGFLGAAAAFSAPLHSGADGRASADSVTEGGLALYANDGLAFGGSAWISGESADGHWLQLDFDAPRKLSEIHLFSGLETIGGSVIDAGEIQVREGSMWRKVAGFSNNGDAALRIKVDPQVEAASFRLWTAKKGRVAVRELAVYGEPASFGEGILMQRDTKHVVCVNQIGYNEGAPKRFTVPTATGAGAKYSIRKQGTDRILFSGVPEDGRGDFSGWVAPAEGGNYTIRVEGGGLQSGDSYPFMAGPRLLQKSLLQPMVDFMIDARSIVGTHASAYGGAAWRDGSYYTHELASLVTLYVAFPDEVGKMPRQIDWQAERLRVLSQEFKVVASRGDQDMLGAVKFYFNKYDAPAEDAPDIVKLIHWGCGLAMAKPEMFDPSGDGIGLQVHSQLVEQMAWLLALQPRLEKWIPARFFEDVRRFTDKQWERTGLLGIPATWDPGKYRASDDPGLRKMSGPILNPYKGRDVAGHSILPNLLMYEAARRRGDGNAPGFLKAALTQTAYVMAEMNWDDPRTTKGQRMSEEKMITGLVWLQQNYPDQAPAGLKRKLEQWADVAISRSDNLWDFRRYDMGANWTIPVMNEPGNLAGFPACALGVSWIIEDPAKKQRLREIAFAALDCLFGRNPINAASPHHPELGWNGMIEKGWPVGFPNGTTARLELCRGALSSSPGSEMYPYNPSGQPRFPEGWSAFNAALNIGIAYIEFDTKGYAKLPEDCLKKPED